MNGTVIITSYTVNLTPSNTTTGSSNSAFGKNALNANTTGHSNTSVGYQALRDNTTGFGNTATGVSALQSNTTGSTNTAMGDRALSDNTTGFGNTATGVTALWRNTTGNGNVAVGRAALRDNSTASGNTAVGIEASQLNTTGVNNTAVGSQALQFTTTGHNNIGLGVRAGFNATIGNNNIYVGNEGVAVESGQVKIGTSGTHTATFIAGISGVNVAGTTVVVDGNGQLGIPVSSRRFKEDIRNMEETSNGLLQLRPVTYRYKKEYANGAQTLEYGLIAEEVAEVYPDLVVYDANGQVQTVQYRKLITMLLNELQKNHDVIQTQQQQLATHHDELQTVSNQLQELRQHNAMLVQQVNMLSVGLEALRMDMATVQHVSAVGE